MTRQPSYVRLALLGLTLLAVFKSAGAQATNPVVREREPNNDAATAMLVQPGTTVDAALTAGIIQGRAADMDFYRVPAAAPGLYTITVTPTLPECDYWVGVPSLRRAHGPSTMTVELTGQGHASYTLRFGGQPESRFTTLGEELRELLVAVDTQAWSAYEQGVQCVQGGARHKEIPYRLTIAAGGTPTAYPPATTSPAPYGSPTVHGQPHLAVYTVSRILGHHDFAYPVVVQLLDGSGRPMYPAAPLTVTVTSSDASIVRMYGTSAPGTATLTLKPPDRPGSGGLSWESVRVAAGSNSVAGNATITATAPGLPAASVTLTTVPTRTPDNRSTPAQTAPAARVSLTVMPPVVETDRTPVIYMDLVDAQGQPTGVDFGPGDWTLDSSNTGVFRTSSSSGRNQILYPVGPGQTQLTLRPKQPGLAGSSAPLTVISPGAPMTTEHAAPPPAPPPIPLPPAPPSSSVGGGVVRGRDFGEPAAPSGRISNIVTARDVRNGAAADITDTFSPDVNPIHVWFRLAGFAPGTTFTSRWTYLGGSAPLVIGTGEFTIAPTNDYGTFSYELAAGKRWPAGEYRVEILLGSAVLGSATFLVRPTQSTIVLPPPARAEPPTATQTAEGPALKTGTLSTGGPPVELAAQPVPATGGTITINRLGDPLHGLVVTVLPGAYSTAQPFRVSSQPITSTTFQHVTPLTPLIHIDNGGEFAERLMTVKVPVRVPAGHFAMAFLYDDHTGRLEGMPTVAQAAGSITVATRHFSKLLVASVSESTLRKEITTEFKAGRDNWQFANKSTIFVNGICAGMSISSLWYYQHKPDGPDGRLHGRYDGSDGMNTPGFDDDDAVAIRLAAMVQVDYENAGVRSERIFRGLADISPEVTFMLFAFSMLVSGPQLAEVSTSDSGHAMVAVGVVNDDILLIDPNHPGEPRRSHWNNGQLLYEGNPLFYMATGALVSSTLVAGRWAAAREAPPRVGRGFFPPYRVLVSVWDDFAKAYIPLRNKDNTLAELKDGMAIPGSDIQVSVEKSEWNAWWRAGNANFSYWFHEPGLITPSGWGGVLHNGTRLTLMPGSNRIGILVKGGSANGRFGGTGGTSGGWSDFRWVNVQSNAAASEVLSRLWKTNLFSLASEGIHTYEIWTPAGTSTAQRGTHRGSALEIPREAEFDWPDRVSIKWSGTKFTGYVEYRDGTTSYQGTLTGEMSDDGKEIVAVMFEDEQRSGDASRNSVRRTALQFVVLPMLPGRGEQLVYGLEGKDVRMLRYQDTQEEYLHGELIEKATYKSSEWTADSRVGAGFETGQ